MNVALSFTVRAARPDDAAVIRKVLLAAFPGPAEADLVEALRRDGDIALSLVACDGDRIVGVVVFSALALDGAKDGRIVALAPLAVDPAVQRRSVGSALIRHGHEALARMGVVLSVVLGDAAYYARFGYSAALAASFRTPYDGPHLLALRLSEAAPRRGTLTYAPAFSGLG